MPDAPMSSMEVRLERVNRAAALERAVHQMAGRHAQTCMRVTATPEPSERLWRAQTRQHLAFMRLLAALTALAQSTDADLQRDVTRS